MSLRVTRLAMVKKSSCAGSDVDSLFMSEKCE